MSLHIPGVHFVNRKILTTAVCTALVSAVAPAYAQQAAATGSSDDVTRIETVTVTGSRISNPNVVSPAPVSVLTAEDIKATGAVNIGDLLTTMPQLATTFTMGNSGRFIGTAGVAMQDLRNLGTARTLVLVNGRRMVGASAGTSAVDTNLIPADWVERVEVITGGASAVYGADAVSGVVNFILKKKYEGANLHAQINDSQHGSFGKKFISVTGGGNFAEDRGNYALSFEHSQQDSLMFGDRFGKQAYRALRTPGSGFDTTLVGDAGNYTITSAGTFSLGSNFNPDLRYTFDRNGQVRKQRFDGAVDRNSSATCTNCDRLDNNQVLQLQPRYKRDTVSAVAGFDLNQVQQGAQQDQFLAGVRRHRQSAHHRARQRLHNAGNAGAHRLAPVDQSRPQRRRCRRTRRRHRPPDRARGVRRRRLGVRQRQQLAVRRVGQLRPHPRASP
jgi:outer membrane receptor for ferrienterochelin and colicin